MKKLKLISGKTMEIRFSKHFELSSQLASMDDNQIHRLLKRCKVSKGWGTNHVVNLSGNKIFVKLLSLTELERKNAFSTKNLFNLPLYYNYGVGSAGMGAFRADIPIVLAWSYLILSP